MNETPKPLYEAALDLCYQIEKCGASTELTTASIMASELYRRIKKEEEELERLNQFSNAIAKACDKWGWSHATTEVELIESINELICFAKIMREKHLVKTRDGKEFCMIEFVEGKTETGFNLCERQAKSLLYPQMEQQLSAATAACAAMREVLETLDAHRKQTSRIRTRTVKWEDVITKLDAALSNPAGQELLKELAELRAWKEEIQGAIHRSSMGILRTTQGPSGTMIGYTEACERAHQEKTLEVIHENIDLGIKVSTQSERIAELEGALKPFDISGAHLRSFEDTNNFTITRTAGQFRAITKALAAKGAPAVTHDPTAITVWPFYAAPQEYRDICSQGGDEDYIAFVPDTCSEQDPSFLWDGRFSCCTSSSHQIPGGTLVVGCHA